MVYVLDYNKMTDAEKALAISAQGVINRKDKLVVIDADKYMDYVVDTDRQHIDVYQLIARFCKYFDGIVLYNLDCHDVGINMATTMAAVSDVLCVSCDVLDKVQKVCSLPIVQDLRTLEGTSAQKQKLVFDMCYDKLNKDGLVHQVVNGDNFHIRLRDLAIVNGWACIYTGESSEDRAFRRYVLEKLNRNIPIYGWNDDEIAFIKDISLVGDYAIPSDWSMNHSYFERSQAVIKQKISTDLAAVAPNKHYVALVVSDGDNIQWLERDFSMKDGNYGQRIATDCNYKMTWTFSPSMVSICPSGAQTIFAMAKKDRFISGVSGVGYANCLSHPLEQLDDFTQLTAKAMQASDLSVVCLLDNVNNTSDKTFVKERLHYYSRFDIIKGGIWELDPDRYGSGHGKIWWCDGKPFVSVRFTMWYPTGNKGEVTKQWLKALANQVNAMPVAPNSADGYSVVNVHPWTMTQADVDYFVSCLDDKCELVYAEELVELVSKNVQAK